MEPKLYNAMIQKPCPSAQERFGKAFCLKHKQAAKKYNDIREAYIKTLQEAQIFTITEEIFEIVNEMTIKYDKDESFKEKVLSLSRFPYSRFWFEWQLDTSTFGFLAFTNGKENEWANPVAPDAVNNMVLGWPIVINNIGKPNEDTYDYGVDYIYSCFSREKIDLRPLILEVRKIQFTHDIRGKPASYINAKKSYVESIESCANQISKFTICFLAFLAEIPYESQTIKKDFTSEVYFKGINHPVDVINVVKIKSGAKRYEPNKFIEQKFNRALEKIRKREHDVRSHWRHYRRPDGSIYHSVEVKSHKRGDASLGRIFHSHYEISVDKT